ncbi:hypothetical protein PR048_011079 [Dryococelus australis]|uniref:Uncharacterized protein n=1 Tax=Dryococelus australis TaxID=614101 RepID=A0ABQ9HKL3_9NEOP|nr:hypothetical protein PR048_011079 [Dryococelus australis]
MSYRRCVMLKKYLHFSDNVTNDPMQHPYTKLGKIWCQYAWLATIHSPKERKVWHEDIFVV